MGWLAKRGSAPATWQLQVKSAGTPVGRKAISNEQLWDYFSRQNKRRRREEDAHRDVETGPINSLVGFGVNV